MYQHGLSFFEEPLDPDSDEEFEGEELDESDTWRKAVWRNAYDFYEGAPPLRRSPSNMQAATAAVGAGAAMSTAAAAVAAAATTGAGGQVHTSSTSHHSYTIPHKHLCVCLT